MRSALTIAGSDSGGGAGVQADLKTFAAHGVYGTCVITAVTAQNSTGVSMFEAMSTDLVTAQIEAVMTDFAAAAVQDLDIPYLVVDPVMIAKSGHRLLDDNALGAMRAELLPRAFLVTPNIPEAEALSGLEIRTDEDRHEAARRIAALGPTAVLLKGGHLPDARIRDLLYEGHTFTEFVHERVPGSHTHGTGCTFSAALTAHLAHGRTLRDSIPLVQRYIAGAIRNAPHIGQGHGPMHHFWPNHDGRHGAAL